MRRIFLDCGAHKATSVRKFRNEYPNAEEYEIISFECNPKFKDILDNTEDITFYNKAVWVEDSKANFYLGKGSSSSLIYGKTRGRLDFDNPIEVETIDFNKWIIENLSKDDYIILKMDIEGAEYEVLNKMLNNSSIGYINKLYIEFHGSRVFKTKEDTKELRNRLKEIGLNVYNWDATRKKSILHSNII